MAQRSSSSGTRGRDTRSAPLEALTALGRTLGGVDTAQRVVERTVRTLEQLLHPHRELAALQQLTDRFIADVDRIGDHKEQEVLEV